MSSLARWMFLKSQRSSCIPSSISPVQGEEIGELTWIQRVHLFPTVVN